MAISTNLGAVPSRKGTASWTRQSGPWLLFGAVLALGYLPHVAAYAGNLMEREHYQFFPLAWLGAIALLWIRRDALRPRADVAVPALGWVGVILAALMLAAAGILNSAWLGMVSVVPMALGLAWLAGGWTTVKGIGPALVMFATTLRPPGNLDADLIRNLRGLAVQFSSRILDFMGVVHVPWGSVIRVPGGDLLVDEACSGINSLVSVLAVVTFLGLLLRRRPLHLVLLLAGSVGIVVLVNVLRVSIVTVAYACWEIDLLKGWKHDAVGMVLYAVSLGLAASLDQLLLLLSSMLPHRSTRRDRTASSYAYGALSGPRQWTEMDPPAAPIQPQSSAGSLPHRLDRIRRRWLIPVVAVLAAIALINPIRWTYGAVISKDSKVEMSHLVAHAEEVISEESLPRTLAGWERIDFMDQERKPGDPFGMRSKAWRYRIGNREAVISLDYPFKGWHELIGCYRATEWKLRERAALRGSSDSDSVGTYAVASMDRADGQFAYLLFGFFNDRGQSVDPPSRGGLDLASREMPWELVPKRPNYQVQAFCTSFTPLSEEEQRQVTRLFEASRRQLHEQLFASGAITP